MDRDRRRFSEHASRLSLLTTRSASAANGSGHSQAATTAQPSADQLSYRLRSAFRQHRRHVLTGGLSAAALVFLGFLFFAPSRYEAYALLRVVPTVPRLVFDNSDARGIDSYETYRQTQASLVTSPEVTGAALSRPEVRDLPEIKAAADPAQWIADQVQVEPLRDTELLRVSLARPDGTSSAIVVNAVVDAYMEQVVEGVDADRSQRMALLEEQRKSWGDELNRKQQRLRELGDEVGTIDSGALGEKQRASLDRYVKVRQEQTRVEIEQLSAQAQLRTYDAQLLGRPIDVPQQSIDAGIQADERVRFYEQSLANVGYELKELRERIRNPEDVAITQLELKQKLLNEALETRKTELRPEIEDRERGLVLEQIQHAVADTQQKIVQLAEQDKVLGNLVHEEQVAADRIGRASLDIKFLRDELKRTEQVYDQVVARLDELRVESKAPGRVTVVAHADTPTAPYQQARRYLVAATLGILAFATVVFAVFGVALANPRIGSPEELIVTGQVGVLGTLPKFSATISPARKSTLPPALPSHREYEAAIDGLRAVLLLDRRQPSHGYAVAVTSAARREGKSTFAAHLAASAARTGKKVLLVDADLYKPSQHKLFRIPLEDGLAQVVGGRVSASAAIKATCVPGLDLLAAGMHATGPNVVLQDEAFPRLTAELSERYDLVVIDAPPVLSVPDALYIGRATDSCILSVLCDESRQTLVEQAHERLTEVGVQVRGAVLHGAPGGTVSSRRRHRVSGVRAATPAETSNGKAAPLGLN